ncbi:serine hydrolase [Fretibacter rubidus]|uniref:serine hydrolase n=1 Tax=Fretibacter rubidus TaxID=570162 RepID=UPI00352A6842
MTISSMTVKALIGTASIIGLSYLAPLAAAHPVNKAADASVERSTPIDMNVLDTDAINAIDAFNTPGMSIGVVHKGAVIYAKGFGHRDLNDKRPVNSETLFRVASTTKAFTAASLAVLVDDGVLDWDDRVIDYLPGFRMSDPWVTREFTIRDLLTHRSGLGLGAGDLMLWPEPTGFTRQEMIYNLRHLKPVSGFRDKYAYDNLLYIVAGEVAAAASGMSWEDLVQSRILDPLEMDCYAGETPRTAMRNTAIPYGFVDEEIVEVTRNKISGKTTASAAAGGLVCNIDGMNTWMQTQLAGGVGPNGVRVFSEAQRDAMWTSQTILRVGQRERELDRTNFKTYALGWRKEDMHGYEVISHTGTLSGFQAYLALIPELELGVVTLNNGSNYGARTAVVQTVLKAYLEQPDRDWVAYYATLQAEAAAKAEAEAALEGGAANDNREGSGTVNRPLPDYAGAYVDPWFGRVDITRQGDDLRFQSDKMVKMAGTLEPFDLNTFIVKWDDREFRADAYMRFETNFDGEISGATMRHVDPEGSWSFNFQDLNFARSED